MRFILFVLALVVMAVPAQAKKDTNMSCAEIEAEIGELEATIAAAADAEVNSTVTNAAAGAATQGAIASGLGSSIPFIGGLANVATSVSSGNAAKAKAEAEKAEKRMIKLETIADMKDCN